MIRPEHPFDIRPDLRKAASTKAESVIRPKQLVRIKKTYNISSIELLTDIHRDRINNGSPVLGDHNTGILVLCTILV